MGIEAAAIGGGLGLVGSMMAADATKSAASTSANAQLRAAQMAADAAKFRPVGVTTNFGTSNFTMDPNGYLQSAGYTLTPEMQAYQNQLMGMAGQSLNTAQQAPQQYAPLQGAAQGLFNLGNQYIAQSPDQVAQDYMAKQQALLAPGREQQSAQLMNQLSNTGRTGLSIAQGGNLMAANPEMAALANARSMQDLQLAANAQQAGQQNVAFGTGLFNSGAGMLNNYYGGQTAATSPFATNLGLAGTVENLGQNAMTIGQQLGGQQVNNTGANALYQGGIAAANSAFKGNSMSPWGDFFTNASNNKNLTSGLANWMSGNTSNPYATNPYLTNSTANGIDNSGMY